MATVNILPPCATELERAVAAASDVYDRLDAAGVADVRGFKLGDPPSAFHAFLLYEYGLAPIAQYHASFADTVSEGISWQRLRGTPAALAQALGWLDYDALSLEDREPLRRLWVRYQVGMGKLFPVGEEIDTLMGAEHLAGLSDPARSVFVRGWHGYDVRALRFSISRWGDSIVGDDSGVRLPDGTVKWSHGRDHTGAVTMTEAQRIALEVDVANGDVLSWGAFPWSAPGVSWNGVTDAAAFKAWLLGNVGAYVGFFEAGDDAIGYRRAMPVRDVTDQHGEPAGTAVVEVECLTGFGDGSGATAATARVCFGAAPIDPAKPGRLWCAPDQITAPANQQTDPVSLPIAFAATVRERVTITVTV